MNAPQDKRAIDSLIYMKDYDYTNLGDLPEKKSLRICRHVNRRLCLNMWWLMYTSLILIEKVHRANKLIKPKATLPLDALSSLGEPVSAYFINHDQITLEKWDDANAQSFPNRAAF